MMLKELTEICQAIVDKKGMNVLVLDVRGICSMTDFFIIADGTVGRHVHALAEGVQEVCKKWGWRPRHQIGQRGDDWVVLDFQDVVVHLFTQELRSLYNLEELWRQGRIVSVPLSYGRPGERAL